MATEIFEQIGRAIAPVVVGLGGTGALWKLVDKLLDIAEAGRKRRADSEGATNAELRQEVTKLNGEIRVLTKEAAAAALYKEANDELKKQSADAAQKHEEEVEQLEKQLADERELHRREIAQKDGDNRQLVTVISVYNNMKRWLDDPDVQQIIRQKMAQSGTP